MYKYVVHFINMPSTSYQILCWPSSLWTFITTWNWKELRSSLISHLYSSLKIVKVRAIYLIYCYLYCHNNSTMLQAFKHVSCGPISLREKMNFDTNICSVNKRENKKRIWIQRNWNKCSASSRENKKKINILKEHQF